MRHELVTLEERGCHVRRPELTRKRLTVAVPTEFPKGYCAGGIEAGGTTLRAGTEEGKRGAGGVDRVGYYCQGAKSMNF